MYSTCKSCWSDEEVSTRCFSASGVLCWLAEETVLVLGELEYKLPHLFKSNKKHWGQQEVGSKAFHTAQVKLESYFQIVVGFKSSNVYRCSISEKRFCSCSSWVFWIKSCNSLQVITPNHRFSVAQSCTPTRALFLFHNTSLNVKWRHTFYFNTTFLILSEH